MTGADLIIGTSAGSTAAAQSTSATPADLLADILATASQRRTGPAASDRGPVLTEVGDEPPGDNKRNHRCR